MNLEESYRVLGLEPGASLLEVRRSYLELVKFFHPDRHHGSPGLLRRATEETKKINLAYEHVCQFLGTEGRPAPGKRRDDRRRRTERSGTAPVQGQAFTIPTSEVELNWVAPGHFRMGSPAGEAGRSSDEGPQTEVTFSRGFWLGTFPVTQAEWKSIAADVTALKAAPNYFRGKRLPVEQVSWEDCQQWLDELNTAEGGRLPHGFKYRLPTEAEWEFACRAGSSTRFHFGDGDDQLDDWAWYSANSESRTHEVGQKKPNAWGLYDMHGNVWEWCEDRYGGPLPGGSLIDPQGPVFGANRVFRGGSWGIAPSRCRSAYRVWNKPDYCDYTIGFRIALAPAG